MTKLFGQGVSKGGRRLLEWHSCFRKGESTSSFKPLALALILISFCPVVLLGQSLTSGSIAGTVTDQSGAVIVGAKVRLTDTATNAGHFMPTNSAGHFVFPSLKPGTYELEVTKPGFQKVKVMDVIAVLSRTTTINETLHVGETTQTVQVTATGAAQLQTMSATMGQTLSGDLMDLPVMNHDVSSLLNYQATASPTFGGTMDDIHGGGVAGATADQNSFVLDGATNTSGLEGDNGYINNFSGSQRGIVPTPIQTIQEVTVNTNNTTADFSTSAGGEILAVTKRGHDHWHGSGYDFFQGSWLNANSWSNNFTGVTKPKSHQNFFGFDIGGPMTPKVAGGKTYFYFSFIGSRNPYNIVGKQTRTVPSASLASGIIQINTAKNGVQSFDLSNPASLSTACGPTGGLPCDPRMIGVSSAIQKMWQQYMPAPNSFNTNGDKLNTFAFRGNLTEPANNNELIGRIDHNFGDRFRFMSRYSWFKQDLPTTNELDIGGLLPGDKKGTFASASFNNNQPAQFVAGLDSTLTPSLTNSFHVGYTRNEWNWIRNGVTPQLSGSAGAIEIDGESTNALIPINVDTQNSRNRAWYEHNYDYRDELAWVKGSHFFTFGGDYLHEWWHFNRYDNVVGGLTNLVYLVNGGSVQMTPDFQPQDCSTGRSPCIDTSDPSELNTWNEFYADLLGIVNHSSVVATRTGPNLQLNPIGTPAASYVTVNSPSVYFSDAWRIRPSLTLSYGLNYVVQMPPHDLNGAQDVLVDPSNNPVTYDNYVASRIAAANQGQIYAPILGFTPVGAVGSGLKYPFRPYYGQFGPRVGMAWNPNFGDGWIGKLFGGKSTVIRGGYARVYGRDLGINIVSNPVLGDGFLQPVSCIPTSPNVSSGLAACVGVQGDTPANAFRIGSNADGLNPTLPAISQTLQSPVQPGIGDTPGAVLTDSMDQNFRPSAIDQADFSIQREFKGNTILEVGYVGAWGHHLFEGIEMNSVPWMLKLGGQTFAQAYANVWQQVHAGATVTPQAFFENALGGTSSSFCTGYASCTDAMVQNFSNYLTTEDVTDFWSGMETSGSWTLPNQALYTDTGQSLAYGPYANTSNGFSNYQAMVVKVTKHTSRGLTMLGNFTYSHSLDTIGLPQTYTLDSPDNVYNLRANWSPSFYDHKFVFNMAATYNLPVGHGQRFLNSTNSVFSRVLSGWSVSPLFTFASGAPVPFYTGSFNEMGTGYDGSGANAVPMGINTRNISNSPTKSGVDYPIGGSSNPNNVGINSDASRGGDGANLFGSNAINVYNSFRPFVLGLDGSTNEEGQLRGPIMWDLDFGVTKDTAITERVHAQFYMQSMNFFNHDNWGGSGYYLDYQDPHNFGTISGGATPPRVIQLGLQISF